MRSSTYFIFFVLLFLKINAHSYHHKCNHNEISKKFSPIQLKDDEAHDKFLNLNKKSKSNKGQDAVITRLIEIVIDDSNIGAIDPAKKDFILGKLVPISTEFFKKRLTVVTRGAPLKFKSETCFKANIPENHQKTGLDADLILYVTAEYDPSDLNLAWAVPCLLESTTGRPIAGQIHFNTAFIDFDPEKFEEQVETTLHEITHILVFNPILFSHFQKSFLSREKLSKSEVVLENTDSKGNKRNQIITPKVVQTAKDYFNCLDITGVDLENEGDAASQGSHWERVLLHNEIMTASSIKDASYSNFTLALMEDSGWYRVNFTNAEPMYFGQGAGCSFVDKKCAMGNAEGRREWCFDEDSLCSFGYKSKAQCNIEEFSNGCKYARAFKEGDCENPDNQIQSKFGETYAPGSRCVLSNIIKTNERAYDVRTSCFKHSCSEGKINLELSDGSKIVCSKLGEKASPTGESKFEGYVICPDPDSFCEDYYPSCPNSCSYKGYCVLGVCECRAGYAGDDCSKIDKGMDI